MVMDVSYWINRLLQEQYADRNLACINTSVEESRVASRSRGHVCCPRTSLLAQDQVIRDNMQDGDTIIISMGGNDIALAPSISTICCAMSMVSCCGTGCIRCGAADGCIAHFRGLFLGRVRHIISQLCSKAKPARVVICVIYYPDEAVSGSWADRALGALGYNRNPAQLQAAIDRIYLLMQSSMAACGGQVDGVPVSIHPLFRDMDGKDTGDYCARVEPSVVGGEKMAKGLLRHLFAAEQPTGVAAASAGAGDDK